MTSAEARSTAARLTPELRGLLAQGWLHGVDYPKLVDWAGDLIVQGRDSPNLRILAGLSGKDSQEVDHYFQRILRELGLGEVSKRECMIHYCGDLAREIIAGTIGAKAGYSAIWKVLLALDWSRELAVWSSLDATIDTLEYEQASEEQIHAVVRETAEHFLQLLACYTETGLCRLPLEQSLEWLRERDFDIPRSTKSFPARMPRPEDENDGLSFFRTRLDKANLSFLTLPRTLFLRSEIDYCQFEDTDLSESAMTWCTWDNCFFRYADLRGCDLRASIFKGCHFGHANLNGADLRGARFIRSDFSEANFARGKLEKRFGLFKSPRAKELKLSSGQAEQIDWTAGRGAEPAGG